MPLEKKLFKLIANTREDARQKVVLEFLNENFGTGKEDLASRYEYTVETYNDYSILLKRPGNRKKGFDFSVNTIGIFYKKKRRYTAPTFDDIKNALSYSKEHFSNEYESVKQIIEQIFNVKAYDLSTIKDIKFIDYERKEHPIVVMLLAIKWIFIAEDISYWNWSGRNKFMNELKEQNLV